MKLPEKAAEEDQNWRHATARIGRNAQEAGPPSEEPTDVAAETSPAAGLGPHGSIAAAVVGAIGAGQQDGR